MTTLIVVAIVGLVFFVTICVAGFMIWKRETEIRTDSIGAIERSIGEVVNELSGINSEMNTVADAEMNRSGQTEAGRGTYERDCSGAYDAYDIRDRAYERAAVNNRSIAADNSRREPYEWVRADERNAGNVSVFRPGRNTSRRLRWTEVPPETENADNRRRPAARPAGRFRSMRRADGDARNINNMNMENAGNTYMTDMQEIEPGYDRNPEPDFEARQIRQTSPAVYGQEAAAHAQSISSQPPASEEQRAFHEIHETDNIPENRQRETQIASQAVPEAPKAGTGDKPQDEINLSLIDLDNLDSISLDEFDFFDNFNDDADEEAVNHADYNTGRSGKKYTAQELESLIKE